MLNQLTGAGSYYAAFNLDGEGRVYSTSPSVGALSSTTYNAAGQPTQVTLASSDSDSFTYDPYTGRMTQYQFTVNGQSVTGNPAWNANGTLQTQVISDHFNSANTQRCSYSYDDLSRVASAICNSAASQTFSYDAFGNINKSGSPYSFQPTYSPSTNRITNIAGFTPTYDGNGNVTNDGLHAYTWDAYGNSLTVDGVGSTFDAFNRSVEQNRSGSYTQTIYSPTGAKLAFMNGQSLVKAFIALPGQATAVYTSSGLDHYRHGDWLGSTRFTSSPGNSYIASVAYAPFGEPYAGTADLSFTGQRQDTVSGLYDFPAREYSYQGRWPSPDPAGLAAVDPTNPQSWNRYAYVMNNPLALIDPTGMNDCPDGKSTCGDDPGMDTGAAGVDLFGGNDLANLIDLTQFPGATISVLVIGFSSDVINLSDMLNGSWGSNGSLHSGNSSGGFFSGILNRTKTVNNCAGSLSQAGSVTNLSGGRVPELLGSNTFGDVASLATGGGGFDQGAALAADATAHAAPSIAAQVAVGTVTTVGRAISNTPGVYNPVTVGVHTARFGATTLGKGLLGAAEGILTGKVLLDAGVYIGALVVCSIQ